MYMVVDWNSSSEAKRVVCSAFAATAFLSFSRGQRKDYLYTELVLRPCYQYNMYRTIIPRLDFRGFRPDYVDVYA
jgi:hypothetical protein